MCRRRLWLECQSCCCSRGRKCQRGNQGRLHRCSTGGVTDGHSLRIQKNACISTIAGDQETASHRHDQEPQEARTTSSSSSSRHIAVRNVPYVQPPSTRCVWKDHVSFCTKPLRSTTGTSHHHRTTHHQPRATPSHLRPRKDWTSNLCRGI